MCISSGAPAALRAIDVECQEFPEICFKFLIYQAIFGGWNLFLRQFLKIIMRGYYEWVTYHLILSFISKS